MHAENLHFPEAASDFGVFTCLQPMKNQAAEPEYVLQGRVSVCVLLNDLVNEKPVLERNHGGTLRVVDVPEEQPWLGFNTLVEPHRGLMAERAGTLSQCNGP